MERLIDKETLHVSFDTWELCGLDRECKRDCWKPTPCKIPNIVRKLASYEDTGLEPEQIEVMQGHNTALTAEVERLTTENTKLKECSLDPVELAKVAIALQENATLKKALELACNDAADDECPHEFDLYTCERCANCPHGSETHTDAKRDAQCWYDYYIHRAQQLTHDAESVTEK